LYNLTCNRYVHDLRFLRLPHAPMDIGYMYGTENLCVRILASQVHASATLFLRCLSNYSTEF
jgi:hypothetical protein